MLFVCFQGDAGKELYPARALHSALAARGPSIAQSFAHSRSPGLEVDIIPLQPQASPWRIPVLISGDSFSSRQRARACSKFFAHSRCTRRLLASPASFFLNGRQSWATMPDWPHVASLRPAAAWTCIYALARGASTVDPCGRDGQSTAPLDPHRCSTRASTSPACAR